MEARGFPGVIGCIDCTHIRIKKPSAREEAYYNHHYRSHSLNVQAICDHDLRILSLSARFPGSVHDQFIWNTSTTREIMQAMYDEGIRNTWLLGDSGYALQPYLLTPIRQAAPNSPEERYTNCHCQTRNCVERLFGVLKNTWRCLHRERVLHYTPEAAARIIISCAVLHNLMITHRQELPPYEDQDMEFIEERQPNVNEDEFAGENARRLVIQQFFTF
ncbi:putative nuclease HARBI1 [Ischnura elegans]|uniref:putative nuclease HARBI1 n=1 Tax=Ischnura elegans TaxID=197161 RepID=UPI001ED8B223|nr:putative nuclease HARBI1 [Ischnura elegans]